ncbi:MAG TPA: glucose-6-phosphate isomerase [Candidatus Polarisedimenticolaceae bacterium]|nr:glucose-6-phosphate isomerase [Candidatus Polarisedimenticolaceae bacterium]
MEPRELWQLYRQWLCVSPELGFRLDASRIGLPADYPERLQTALGAAFDAMERLERGEIANPDEERQVGHYWLRAPDRAPTPEIRDAIVATREAVLDFAARVHRGELRPARAERFTQLLVVGIGGSALGPQFVADALGGPSDLLAPHFLDNTDPDGFDRVLGRLGVNLERTLVVVISKSGGTPETRNGLLETAARFRAAGLELGPHAVAVTQAGSRLDIAALEQRFLARFPMWDWVGGRTSELSAVGLLPAALQGIDVRGLLDGAARMDELTRQRDARHNPAALLALCWYHVGDGRGTRDMVVLPYKDRLALFSRYLQQLVMESLGKELDLQGHIVHQGLAVYGNKGSTDQHAYVQQLRDGLANFFVTFVEVLRERQGPSLEVDPGATSGDYLHGFLLGTREALYANGRPSLTITVADVSPQAVGQLIALFERAVGLYAALIGINAYHQPGVEAGKRAASAVLDLERRLFDALRAAGPAGGSAEQLAAAAGSAELVETAWQLLERLAANPERGVARDAGASPFDAVYRLAAP